MITVVGVELSKLFHQRKSWLTLFFMNMVGIGCLLLLMIPPVAESVSESAGSAFAMTQSPEQFEIISRRMLAFLVLTWAHFFSLLATFFMALVCGSLLAAEFGTGSIQVLMVAPVGRLRVFAGKVLAAVAFYGVAWLVGLGLLGLCWMRLQSLDPNLVISLEGFPLGKALAAYALVDLSMIAFFLLISGLSSSESGAVALSLGCYFGLQFLDFLLWLASELEVLPELVVKALPYTFTRTAGLVDFGQLYEYVGSLQADFPLKLDMLGANVAWTAALLTLGYLVFRRREQLQGS